MNASFALGLLFLLGGMAGGGNDLLDYLPTDAYWRTKGIGVKVDAMLWELDPAAHADLPKLLSQLKADDGSLQEGPASQVVTLGPAALPALREAATGTDLTLAEHARRLIARIEAAPKAAAVRRLMAIRALGEMRAAAALPALRTLAQSDDPFAADYARAAVAAIEGKPVSRTRAGEIGRDVWLLPGDVRAVVRYDPAAGAPAPISPAWQRATLPPGVTPDEAVSALVQAVLPLAEQIGNVRFDGATLGISGDIGERSGYVMAIARGRYDRAALGAALAATRVPGRAVDGVQVFQPNQEIALLLAADDRLVVVASPQGKALPLGPAVAAARGASGGLGGNAEMVNLIRSIDTSRPLWAVAKTTEAYRQILPHAAFDTLQFGAWRGAADAVSVRLQAAGSDPTQAAAAADALRAQLAGLAGAPEGDAGGPARLLGQFARGVRVEARGGAVETGGEVRFSRQDVVNLLAAALTRPGGREDAGQ